MVGKKFGKIGVLMGGPSSEREISLKSGHAVYENLSNAGYKVAAIDIKEEGRAPNIKLLKEADIDVAFIALHGRFGEDGRVQKILEELGIPYTGSGVGASELAMDKSASQDIFKSHGLSVPKYRVFNHKNGGVSVDDFSLPLVVKPVTGGSSIGLSIIETLDLLNGAVNLAFNYDQRIIIEEYVRGRELTVGVLDEQPLDVIEIVPKHKFFDFESKYKVGMSEYIVPAALDRDVTERVKQAALQAHKLLNCWGCSRTDIILREDNIPYVLEVNTIPGLTETSLLPKAARAKGLDFTGLCLKLLELAYEKKDKRNSR